MPLIDLLVLYWYLGRLSINRPVYVFSMHLIQSTFIVLLSQFSSENAISESFDTREGKGHALSLRSRRKRIRALTDPAEEGSCHGPVPGLFK